MAAELKHTVAETETRLTDQTKKKKRQIRQIATTHTAVAYKQVLFWILKVGEGIIVSTDFPPKKFNLMSQNVEYFILVYYQ